MSELCWRKSTYSGGANGECVEVGIAENVGVRDTKDRDGGQLALGAASWSAFITNLKK
jgi:hypothetical protein